VGKRLKRFLRYLVLRATAFWVALLPVSWARALGRVLGGLSYTLFAGERRKALDSLQRAFPDKTDAERRALARACFAHLGQCAGELACIRKLDPSLERLVAWADEDRHVLDVALKRGRGVVFVSGHVGNWELLARRMALAGCPGQTVGKEMTDARLTAWVDRYRASGKVRTLWRGRDGAAKAMLKILRAGEILGLVVDQDTKVQSVFVPFFGTAAATPRAPADLALRTGAVVVVGFCQRQGDGRYALSMKEVRVAPTGEHEADVVALTAAMTQEIETAIRRAPEQWVWMHRRWKTRP
jgi:KDO2-lipid IV(A) lauroyltransferase